MHSLNPVLDQLFQAARYLRDHQSCLVVRSDCLVILPNIEASASVVRASLKFSCRFMANACNSFLWHKPCSSNSGLNHWKFLMKHGLVSLVGINVQP
ncbi:hypothetical protein B0E33_02760 [Roseibium algicola]|uniref:RNase H type-1 domain-containing protein n=1 Tax=Roseibium algicola TaxID=2857014 RepID=A0ABM6HXK5_9HYPH|nr:hypothetical protein B0E33_02760 [Roseibium aggregatum]